MTMMPCPKESYTHARVHTPIYPSTLTCCFCSVQTALILLSYHRHHRGYGSHYQNYYPHYSTRARRSSSTKTKDSLRSSSSGYPAGCAAPNRHSSAPRWSAPWTAAPKLWPQTTSRTRLSATRARPSHRCCLGCRGTTCPCTTASARKRSPSPSSGPPSRPSCAA